MDALVAIGISVLWGLAVLQMTRHPFRRYRRRLNDDVLQPWREAAAAANVTGIQETGFRPRMLSGVGLTGKREPFRLEFRRIATDNKAFATVVTIQGLPPGLTLKLETGATRSAHARGQRDLELGDLDFDDEVYVQGPGPLAQGLMDSGMRLRVRSMVGNDVSVRAGELRAIVPTQYGGLGTGAPLKAVLPLLFEFAERLMRPADLVERLAANARQDPVARVRLANLLTLAREYPEHASTRPAMLAALADRDDEVRLRAATFLPLEGIAALLQIAGGENTDDSCAGEAVTMLGTRLPTERALAILIHSLRARRIATASACLTALGLARSPDAIGTLAKVLSRENGRLAEVAARALGEYARPETEAALIAALDHPAGPARLAAAEALGSGGSVAAVEPLRLAEAHQPADGQFRRAARQAIAAIQSRAGSATPGQLTLAEGESGRLSLEGDAAGHVSLTPAGKNGPAAAHE